MERLNSDGTKTPPQTQTSGYRLSLGPAVLYTLGASDQLRVMSWRRG